jgi:spore germination protein (amino acid permease)
VINLKNQIKPLHLAFLVIETQIGVGLFMLPAKVHAAAQGDAWMSVLVGGLLAQLFIVIIWCLSRRFPSRSLYDYLPALLGKYIGKLVQFVYAAYFIFMTSFIMIRFARTIRDWVLIDTPKWVVIGMITSLCIYLVRENLQKITRFFNLTFVFNIVLIIIIAFAYVHVNFLYILPVGQAGLWNITKGAHETMGVLAGYEILLICYPFVTGNSTGKLKAVSIANMFSTFLYAFGVFTSLIVFSPPELKLMPQPLLYMVKSLTYSVIERPDLYFISLWMVSVTTSCMGYFFMASKGVAYVLQQKGNHRKVVPYTAAVVFIISLVIQDEQLINTIGKIISIVGYVIVFAIPLILLMISVLFKVTGAREETR